MKYSRRTFFKQGLAGSLLLGSGALAHANEPDPIKPKTAKAVNPFRLGMAGYTFVNFDLDTTLRTLERLDIHYLCIKDFHLPLDSTDEQIRAFHAKCAEAIRKSKAVPHTKFGSGLKAAGRFLGYACDVIDVAHDISEAVSLRCVSLLPFLHRCEVRF